MIAVVLDRGHGDKGGTFDPGVVHGGLREVDVVEAYMAEAARRLDNDPESRFVVRVLREGSYDARHREAIRWAAVWSGHPAIYVQCHVNAGGGKYGVVEHDARSSHGRTAAACLADALDEVLEVSTARVWSLHPGERGWVCIDDIYASPSMCGVIYEPGFLDGPTHAPLWTPSGLSRVAGALATGISRYAQARGALTPPPGDH